MDKAQVFGFVCALLALTVMFELIRRQNIKEKYAVLWMLTAAAIVVVAIYPHVLDVLADVTGIKTGPNVLLLVGGLVFVMVCVQMSIEISRMEDRSRALAEEIGLLRLELAKSRPSADI